MKGRELPLRIHDQPGGAIIRCLCGRKLAQLRKGLIADQAFVRHNDRRMRLSPDITSAGLAAMVAHALTCDQAR